MDQSKIKNMKKYFQKTEDTTSRNESKLSLGIERYLRFSEVINLWKKATYIFMFISLIFMGLSIYSMKRSTVLPYVVRMDASTGALVETKVLKNSGITLNEKEIEYFVRKFYTNIRTVTLDRSIFNTTMGETSAFLTPSSQKKLNDMLGEVEELFNKRDTRNIEIISFNKIPNIQNTYQIRWIESQYNDKGELESKNTYNSVTKIDFFNPTEKEITINPLGIVILDFTISKETKGDI